MEKKDLVRAVGWDDLMLKKTTPFGGTRELIGQKGPGKCQADPLRIRKPEKIGMSPSHESIRGMCPRHVAGRCLRCSRKDEGWVIPDFVWLRRRTSNNNNNQNGGGGRGFNQGQGGRRPNRPDGDGQNEQGAGQNRAGQR